MSGISRALLTVLGLAAVLAGVLVILINTNLLGLILQQLGTGRRQPAANDPMLPLDVTAAPDPALMGILLGAAVLVAVLSVWWLVAQLPRSVPTPDFRLQSDVSRGSTVVTPLALGTAISRQLEQLPGVSRGTAVVRGAVQAPHVEIRATVDDRSDVADVVARIVTEVGGGLADALGHPVDRLQVLIGVGRPDRTDAAAVLQPERLPRLG